LRKHHISGRTTKPDSATNFYTSIEHNILYAAFCQCLNYAVAPAGLPIEDIISGVEKAVKLLPVKVAEEARQETVMKLRDSSGSRVNLTVAEKMVLSVLRKNSDLTILLADNGNVTVVLNTVDYDDKIGALLQDPAYRKSVKTPQTFERKTSLLFKKSTLAKEVCRRLHPTGTRPLRLYGLHTIRKERGPLRPIVSNIGTPTYKLSKYLSGLLSPLVGAL
jgi:hypothetical protein